MNSYTSNIRDKTSVAQCFTRSACFSSIGTTSVDVLSYVKMNLINPRSRRRDGTNSQEKLLEDIYIFLNEEYFMSCSARKQYSQFWSEASQIHH